MAVFAGQMFLPDGVCNPFLPDGVCNKLGRIVAEMSRSFATPFCRTGFATPSGCFKITDI